MKLTKQQWVTIIMGIIAIVVIWYLFFRKKTESSFDTFGSPNDPFGDDNPKCPAGEVYSDSLPGCIAKESSYANRIVKRYIVGKTAIIYNPVYGPAPLSGGGGPSLMYIQPYTKVSRGFNFTGAPVTVPLNTTVYPQSGQLVTITTTPVLAVEFIYNGVIKYILAKDVQEIGVGVSTNVPIGSNESGYVSKAPPTTAQLKAAGVTNSRTAHRYLQQHYGNEQGITISFGGCPGQQTPYGYVNCKKMFCIFGVCVCSCPSDAQQMLANIIK